ncbi:MAG: rsgA [Chitinophagaceae bacterium]|nr:rsgA [Chitinophagaceae bacterium]
MNALVYKSTGSWYVVKTAGGETFNARIKGIFKIGELHSTNPLAVGDHVEIEFEDDTNGKTAVINFIADRKNYIARSSPKHKMQHHIIASNLDQVILFATLKDPKTSTGFLDRFLVAAEAYHVPPVIVFNKADIYREKEIKLFERINKVYSAIGYRIILSSVKDSTGMDEVKELLIGKTTLLSGHSGVGKSSFINAIFPEINLKTQEVSGWSGKGLHTTTFAEMFDIPAGGKIIDTPGIREFGVIDIEKPELSHYFPEMRKVLPGCQFNNCLHINEPDCAVKDAVAEGKIAEDRYVSYYNILTSMDEAY